MSRKEQYPKITELRRIGTANSFAVFFTKYRYMQVEDWTRATLRVWEPGDSPKHVYVNLPAQDELQAYTRFRQWWAGLPKRERANG